MFPGGEFEYEHDLDGLLRGDFASRQTGFAQGRQWGWFSANDVRKAQNMNPIGPEGDIYLTPLNMTDATNDPKPPVIAPAPKSEVPGPDPKPGLSKEEVKSYTLGLFEDSLRRSLHYDRNGQLRKSVSLAFVRVLGLMAKMRGLGDSAETVARSYADDLYLRRDEWDGKQVADIVHKEFDLAFAAMELKEPVQ